MGIILGDLSKKILEQDIPYFTRLIKLIGYHQHMIAHYHQELDKVDETCLALDYLKRQALKNPENDVAPHVLLETQSNVTRQFAQADLIFHSACAKLFQDALTSFILTKYHVHEKQIDEWHVDLEAKMLYRKVRTSEEETMPLEDVQESQQRKR